MYCTGNKKVEKILTSLQKHDFFVVLLRFYLKTDTPRFSYFAQLICLHHFYFSIYSLFKKVFIGNKRTTTHNQSD